jgi:hypothetical protein
MGGAGRRQALRPRRRTSAQGERVVGDLGDGEATVAGRGNELGDPLLDRSRPLLIVTLIGFGVPKPATGGPQAAVGAFPAPGYPGGPAATGPHACRYARGGAGGRWKNAS